MFLVARAHRFLMAHPHALMHACVAPCVSALYVCLIRLAYVCAGVMLVFSTPLCCAIFPQHARMAIDQLEPELQARIAGLLPHAQHVYFNKGL